MPRKAFQPHNARAMVDNTRAMVYFTLETTKKTRRPASGGEYTGGMPCSSHDITLANPTEVDTIWGNMLQVFYNIVGVNENKYYLLHIPQCRLFIRTKIFVILSSTSVRNVI